MVAAAGALAGVLGTKIVDFFTNKVSKVTATGLILAGLYAVLPFDLRIPTDIFNFIISDQVMTLIYSVSYIFPVKFIMLCLVTILFFRHIEYFYSLLSIVSSWLVKVFVDD